MKYEEQAKDKEKVKVLRIGYKTVSQTMGNQKQKEKRTGNTKRKSTELVLAGTGIIKLRLRKSESKKNLQKMKK